MMFESTCQFESHELKPILGVCTNLTCKNFRPYCHQCLIEFHSDHITEIRDLQQISFWAQSCAPLQEQLIQSINQYSSIVDKLTNLKNSLEFNTQIDLSLLRLSDLDNYITCVVNLSSIQDFIQEIFNKSQDQLEVVSILCKETISLQKFKENIYYQQDKPEELQVEQIEIISEANENQKQSIEKQPDLQIVSDVDDSKMRTPEKQKKKEQPKPRNSEQNRKIPSNYYVPTAQTRSQSYKNQISATQQRNSISNLKKSNIQQKPKQLYVNTFSLSSKEQSNLLQILGKKSEDDNKKSIKTQPSEIQVPCFQDQIVIQQKELSPPKVQGFRFSENLKSQRIKLQKDCKIAIGFGGFCLCEPSIPMEGQSTFEIMIDKCDLVYLGICNKYAVQSYDYEPSMQAFDTHGSYLISNNGFSYSCLEQEFNNVKQKLNFSSGDRITIIVNYVKSQITWKTKYKNLLVLYSLLYYRL
ncbi:unnamed protein product [Paramecium octaurelia]|uniref:Uncharacterized protein n=1 Tax=Paramecium octaurelia TaxID=43137 RepID=A0A8S1WC27_PAROT|nr:unnamed protein product [Paramecium octaurelia]